MGVRGLKTFVGGDFLECVELSDRRVVIDGNGLYHFIHDDDDEIQSSYAGDYLQFEKSARKFFKILETCKIEAFVVFDGAMDKEGRKWESGEVQKRAEDKLTDAKLAYPLLTFETLRQVLTQLEIPHFRCDYEGDASCVALANHLECPVMADDSDFFVFDLEAGYIPFDTLIHLKETRQAKIYYQRHFLFQFGLRDKKMMPLFATLMGNDFVENESFNDFFSKKNFPQGKTAKMKKLLEWLEGRETYQKALGEILEAFPIDVRSETRALIEKSVELYTHLPQTVVDYFPPSESENASTELKLPEGSLLSVLSDQFYKLIPKGQVSRKLMNALKHGKFFLDPQVESIAKNSAFQCSRPIRAATYAILLGLNNRWTICEHDRVKGVERFQEVRVTLGDVKESAVASLQKYNIQLPNDRRSTIFDILEIESHFIESIEDENFKLVVMTLMYWGKNTELPLSESHVLAVLVSLLVYGVLTPTEVDNGITTPTGAAIGIMKEAGKISCDRSLVHYFAQFQACFYDILHLNQILMSPFPSPSPARFYDGNLLHDLTKRLKVSTGENRARFVDKCFKKYDSTARATFRKLYSGVRDALPSNVFLSEEQKPVAAIAPLSNRFHLLEESSE